MDKHDVNNRLLEVKGLRTLFEIKGGVKPVVKDTSFVLLRE